MAGLVILGISIILQLGAAGLALRLIPVTRGRRAWLLISGALLFMAVRRVITLAIEYSQALPPAPGFLAEALVTLVISALMLGGIAGIAPLFLSITETNAALVWSEAKYRELVQNANSIIMRLDPAGRITFFNEFAQIFFGYTPEEILGRPALGAIVPETDGQGRDLAGFMRNMVANPERYPTSEHEIIRRNGEGGWVTWTHRAVRDEQGRLTEILCVGNDTTACKRAEHELLEQTWLLEAFFQHTITPLVILDKDFNYIRVNQAYARACRRDVSEFPGRNHFDLYPSPAKSVFKRVVATKVSHEAFAQPYIFPDQPERGVTYFNWTLVPILNSRGEVEFLVFVLQEVTEREQAMRALRESEEKYRLLVSNIPALVFKGYFDWSVDFFDDKVEVLTGYPKNDFDARFYKWSDLILAEDLPEAQRIFGEALKARKPYFRNYRIKSRDNQVIWIEERGRCIFDQEENLAYISGVFYDITKSKTTEEALRKSEEQLLQAQKMEAVGRLAGGVAHDFNNLLTGIIGFAELLLMELDSQDPHRREVEEIKKTGERAASLTRQLLAFSRKQILQPRKLKLNSVIMNMEKLLQRLIGEDIFLATNLQPDLGLIEADPFQVEQVIINLAVNARDALPNGGKLTLETANVELDDSYACRDVNFQPGSYVMMAVSDNGAGMDEETISHIFEPFFTTKGREHGTGLGLSTVYGIVIQSGGYIWVYSEPHWGTTFKIYLPRAAQNQEPVKISPEVATSFQGWETILLVEDEEVVRKMVSAALRQNGYRVLTAADPKEALAVCRRNPGSIHLLLTDVVMPHMSGRKLAERLTAHYPDLKVLYISGYPENAISHHGILTPGIAFLPKPFTPGTLSKRVRKVLDGPGPAHTLPKEKDREKPLEGADLQDLTKKH